MRALPTVVGMLALAAAGCGGADHASQGATGGAPVEGKRGGTLTSLWAADTDNIDPGITYGQVGFQIARATQRALFTPKVDDPSVVEPDLAAERPEIAADACRVTVPLKRGVSFSPPVGREVTSADVKYAIERGFFRSVNNGYAGAYFGGLRGAAVGADPGTRIPGLMTPDEHTIVFALERPDGSDHCAGGILAAALVMPLSAPVPREYAKRFDAKRASTYGEHQVATGPYMVENDDSGTAVGYEPGRRIRLVRNPNWNVRTDTRPAYLDEIDIREGNYDTTVMARRILEGESMINGDQPPPPAVLRRALAERKDQIQLVPLGGTRWVTMNTTIPPFDDLDVRRAVIAGFDREAMRLAYGGEVSGDIPTHFLPPGMAGFAEAGGLEGEGLDYMSHPHGDMSLAAEYFRRAGFPSGRYDGDKTFLMMIENTGVGEHAGEVAQQQFEKLGFRIRVRRVSLDVMFGKFCGVLSANVAICPTAGWLKDFADPQTFLDLPFNGDRILKSGNSNWSQLDDPDLNERMRDAALLTSPAERAKAWGDIDDRITELAPAVPWLWQKFANIRSANVVGTIDEDLAAWSLAHTRLR
ncbi:MAG TPA: ABC transporter substrate-binding protein [Solirubrobacteraceae bacterium]|nr:ABC transporter substrate-binding protein [Solirubrobacteraceae bacterium]